MRRNPQSLLTTPKAPRPAIATDRGREHNNGDRKIWERGHASTWTVTSTAGVVKATLPFAPSANEYWRHRCVVPKNGKPFVQTYLSEDAVAYKKLIAEIFDRGMVGPTSEPVVISYRVFRPQKSGDLMNREKVLSDALIGHAWKDDDQIVEGRFYREDDKDNPRIEVEIKPHAAKANGVLEF